MGEDYALLTHSLSPPANRWCFQIGTVCLISSISARQASKASPRCALDTATTTARSPTLQVADPVHGGDRR